MQTLTHIPLHFNLRALLPKLRIAEHGRDAEDLRRLIDSVAPIAKPKAVYATRFIQARTDETVMIGGTTFASRALRFNLDKVQRVFPFIATCGNEFDEIPIPGDDMLKRYWLDELKTVALESARARLFAHLKRQFALDEITGMSPGAGDRDLWPIEQQRELFALLGDTEAAIGVRLTDNYLMIPNKSVSGIAFPAKVTFESCRLCHRPRCTARTAPFDAALFDKIQKDSRHGAERDARPSRPRD